MCSIFKFWLFNEMYVVKHGQRIDRGISDNGDYFGLS